MSDLLVKPVTDKAGIRDFLQVPFTVFKDDPNWVAPLFLERQEHLDPRKNPYFQHAEVQLFVAYRHGKPVGRISAQDDRLRLQTHADNKGMFGFLDAIDDNEVFAALFNAASSWLKARGRTAMLGPFNFSINDELGLLIAGFDTAPNMMMAHGRPYYAAHVEKLGAKKAKDVFAYHYDLADPPLLSQKIARRALASPDYQIRPLNLSDIKSEVRLLVDIFNDAWSANWGFVPWTQAELDKLGKDMKLLITPQYGYVASYKGEPAAFAVTLPNLNDWIKGMNGKVLPFNWLTLASKVLQKKPSSVRMPLMGVRRKYHGTTIGSALSTLVIETARAYQSGRGGKTAELSWILEDNLPVRKLIESFGATAYKTYRIYEMPL
jgi:GNAT superfamily N-acetyltransferase